jgi:hypothetical protein
MLDCLISVNEKHLLGYWSHIMSEPFDLPGSDPVCFQVWIVMPSSDFQLLLTCLPFIFDSRGFQHKHHK